MWCVVVGAKRGGGFGAVADFISGVMGTMARCEFSIDTYSNVWV